MRFGPRAKTRAEVSSKPATAVALVEKDNSVDLLESLKAELSESYESLDADSVQAEIEKLREQGKGKLPWEKRRRGPRASKYATEEERKAAQKASQERAKAKLAERMKNDPAYAEKVKAARAKSAVKSQAKRKAKIQLLLARAKELGLA